MKLPIVAAKPLPCFPCPHNSACCAYGVDLVGSEAAQIAAKYGEHVLTTDEDGTPRTKVDPSTEHCVFWRDNACTLHDTPFYPSTCRGFPLTNAEGSAPYEYDVSICPELA